MNEEILKEYFQGQVEPEVLNDNLIGSHVKTTEKGSNYEIVEMSIEFQVEPEHIINLCRDVINGKIQPEYLQIIAFALISSQYFVWDCNSSKRADEMDAILNEWCSPAINYDLNVDNIQNCLMRLLAVK